LSRENSISKWFAASNARRRQLCARSEFLSDNISHLYQPAAHVYRRFVGYEVNKNNEPTNKQENPSFFKINALAR
jgi:hypothetical protein